MHVALAALFLLGCSPDGEEAPDRAAPELETGSKMVSDWDVIAPGFSIMRCELAAKSELGNSVVTVVRIDPERFTLRLLTAAEMGHGKLTVDEWRKRYDLLAVINAGMFAADHTTHLGYARSDRSVHQAKVRKDYLSVAAFGPKNSTDPRFRVFDADEVSLAEEILPRYSTVVQNLRLIKRPGDNRWTQQAKKWSEAALGEDKDGNILFIFCRSPYSMHDLNKHLLTLPVDLVCAQHLEGGPEASLLIDYMSAKLALQGSFETGFNENDRNQRFWPVPNVFGIVVADP